jgi:hypothetical protein
MPPETILHKRTLHWSPRIPENEPCLYCHQKYENNSGGLLAKQKLGLKKDVAKYLEGPMHMVNANTVG